MGQHCPFMQRPGKLTRCACVSCVGRDDIKFFESWSCSFHGVKSQKVLNGVLDCGGLVKPGDHLVNGTVLRSTKCAGRQDEVFYISPNIRYTPPAFAGSHCDARGYLLAIHCAGTLYSNCAGAASPARMSASQHCII